MGRALAEGARRSFFTPARTVAACTVAYFVTACFFLPETKGKTLEEIEKHFEGKR